MRLATWERAPAAIATAQQLGVARFGLCKPPLRPGDLLLHLGRCSADLLVRALKKLGKREFHVRRNPLNLGQPILARFLQERRKRLFVAMARNATDASAYFALPQDRVVTMGGNVDL